VNWCLLLNAASIDSSVGRHTARCGRSSTGSCYVYTGQCCHSVFCFTSDRFTISSSSASSRLFTATVCWWELSLDTELWSAISKLDANVKFYTSCAFFVQQAVQIRMAERQWSLWWHLLTKAWYSYVDRICELWWAPPVKLQPRGSIEMCVLSLLLLSSALLLPASYNLDMSGFL